MRSPIAILLYVFLPLLVGAQQRFELLLNHDTRDVGYTLVSMYEQGLAIISESSKSEYTRENKWNITLLDTALQATFTTAIPLDNRYTLLGHDYNSGKVYFLFYNSNHIQEPYHLIRLDQSTRELTRYAIAHELDYTLSFFYVVEDNALFGGKISREPLVMSFNLEQKSTRIIPGFFQGNTELLDVHPNINNSFSVLTQKNAQGVSTLYLKILNTSGETLFEAQTKIESPHTIMTGFSSALGNDELVVAGTWTQGKSKMACGFYSWRIHTQEDSPEFVNFLELNEFINYQNKRQQERLRQKAARQKAKGHTPSYYVYIKPTRLEENAGGFFLHAEVKELITAPVSRNPYFGNTNYSGYYGMYRDYYGPFNPYYQPNPWRTSAVSQDASVLESVAIQFDTIGRRKNDYSMPMQNSKGNYDDQKSDFSTTANQLTFVAKDGAKIYRKRIAFNQQQAVLDTLFLLPDNDKKGEDLSENSGIRFWYANRFYAWGYQSYIPAAGRKSIDVFYVAKVKDR